MNTFNDSASKYIELATNMLKATKKRNHNDAESPKTKAQEKIKYLNERIKLVTNDDCYSPLTKERIKQECNIEKRALGRVLAGGDDFISRVLPMSNGI